VAYSYLDSLGKRIARYLKRHEEHQEHDTLGDAPEGNKLAGVA